MVDRRRRARPRYDTERSKKKQFFFLFLPQPFAILYVLLSVHDETQNSAPSSSLAPIGNTIDLPADINGCHAIIIELFERLMERETKNRELQHRIENLLRKLYGRSREQLNDTDMVLFREIMDQLQPRPEPVATPVPPAPANSALPDLTKAQTGQGHGRRKLPADLPRQKILHDLPEDQKLCPCCGVKRSLIGQESSEQLEIIPAKLLVLEHIQFKYACKSCEQKAKGAQITLAEKPLSPIEKGLAAPGLLAYVVLSKYGDHLPMYRMESILARSGMQFSRSTLCGWAAGVAVALTSLYRRMRTLALQSPVVHTDDTPVDVLDPQAGGTHTGRFWVYVGDQRHPYNVFDFTPSRSRDGPVAFLQGWSGFLQADAFGGYDGIYAGKAGGQVVEVACWAHVRRKFYDARASDSQASIAALAHIRLLYDVEDQANQQELDAPQRAKLRQEMARPRLEAFQKWMLAQQAINGGHVLPKSPVGEAITYALNQWEALCIYITDGRLAIDNNVSENALRRVALGRKNWLFAGSDNGGTTAAILYTLISTCQRCHVEPWAYLRDVLTRIPATTEDQLDKLLPDRWRSQQLAAAAEVQAAVKAGIQAKAVEKTVPVDEPEALAAGP